VTIVSKSLLFSSWVFSAADLSNTVQLSELAFIIKGP
jgi:hypothetical protein